MAQVYLATLVNVVWLAETAPLGPGSLGEPQLTAVEETIHTCECISIDDIFGFLFFPPYKMFIQWMQWIHKLI